MGSSGTSPIIGPPFTAQMMPSSLSPAIREGLAVFFNIDTLGSAYTPPHAQNALAFPAPKLSEPMSSEAKWDVISSAILTLKKQQNFADVQQSLWNKDRWVDTLFTLQGIADLKSAMTAQSTKETDLYKTQEGQILVYNSAVNEYNAALSKANAYTFGMHNEQTGYLAGTTPAATYNLDVGIWNSTVGAQNTELQAAYTKYQAAATLFNSQVAQNNAIITALNESRKAALVGGSTIKPQTGVTVAPAPTVLHTLQLGPVPPTAPSILPGDLVPSSYQPLANPPLATSISTTLDMTPLPSEVTLFNSIKSSIDAINQGTLFNYNMALFSAQSDPKTQQLITALTTYQQNPNQTNLNAYTAALTTYLTFANQQNKDTAPVGALYAAAKAYIDAVNNYNNNILPGLNDSINTANDARVLSGVTPPIPNQDPIDVPSIQLLLLPTNIGFPPPNTNPFTGVTSAVLPKAPKGTSTPTSSAAFLSKYFTAIFDTQLAAFKAYTNILSLQDAYRSYLHLVLQGKTNVLPNNSYLERFNQVYANTGTGSNPIGGGASAIASIVGLDSNSLSAVISQALFSAALNNYINAPSQQDRASEAISLVALQALQTASVYAGLPALGLLSGNLEAVGPNSATTDTAVALSALKSITGLVGSGGLEENIKTALNEALKDSGLTASQITDIVKIATASVSIGVLLFGVLAVSKALNLPGLLGQVVGSAFDQDTIGKLITQLQSTTVGTVLANPVSVIFLKETLANAILNKGLSQSKEQAQFIANDLVNRTLANQRINSDLELRASLNATLLSANFNAADAAALAAQGANFVRGELLIRGLDTSFSEKNLNNQLLQNPLFFNPDIQQAIAQHESFETIRQFRDALSLQLLAAGKNQTDADNTANQAAFAIQSNDLKRAFDAKNIDQQQLANSLLGSVSPENAQNISSQLRAQGFNSEQLMREAIAQQLKPTGLSSLDAQKAAANAIIVPSQTDPLKNGNGQILSPDQLAAQLALETTNQLKLALGTAKASDIGNQLALLLVGAPPSSQQVYVNDVNNSASVFYQLKNAVDFITKAAGEKATAAVQEDFSRTMKPTVSTLDLLERFLDPANSLVLSGAWGLMYSGTNAEPSNFKKSIDIRI